MSKTQNTNIGWINGYWGPIHQLTVPITDRGLTLGDGIFETILIYQGKVQLLTKHLDRWHKSASILNMTSPPSIVWLQPLIDEAIERNSLTKGNGSLRINWSRGDNHNRGLAIPKSRGQDTSYRFWLEVNPGEPCFDPVSTMISRYEQRNANSKQSQCKAFSYGQSISARHEAKIAGYDEALLLSTNGELCCSTSANILVKRNNEWLTPRIETGCLPGVMRQQGIDAGFIHEAKINEIPNAQDEWLLINSLSCRAISKCNTQSLKLSTDSKELWFSLLKINM